MSAGQYVLHNIFNQIVAEYHPFAEYEGYAETDYGFVVQYRGSKGEQYMCLDHNCNVIDDTTLGTTRTTGLVALGAAFLSALMGDS